MIIIFYFKLKFFYNFFIINNIFIIFAGFFNQFI